MIAKAIGAHVIAVDRNVGRCAAARHAHGRDRAVAENRRDRCAVTHLDGGGLRHQLPVTGLTGEFRRAIHHDRLSRKLR